MKLHALAGALAALCLAACSTITPLAPPATAPPASPAPVTPTPYVPLVVYKTAAEADLAWNTAQRLYIAALPSLSAARKAQLKPLFAAGERAIETADAASDAATFAQAAAVVADIVAQVTPLLQKAL